MGLSSHYGPIIAHFLWAFLKIILTQEEEAIWGVWVGLMAYRRRQHGITSTHSPILVDDSDVEEEEKLNVCY